MPSKKLSCPACGQRVGVKIVYGYPTSEAFAAEERQEIALGGCCEALDAPQRHCVECGHEWRPQPRAHAAKQAPGRD
jgi:hypothetical protein